MDLANTEQFKCYYCRNVLPISHKKKGTGSATKRTGKCKKCHSEYVNNNALRKRVELSPHKYVSCDECDSYMCRTKRNNKERIKNCIRCGSEKLSDA